MSVDVAELQKELKRLRVENAALRAGRPTLYNALKKRWYEFLTRFATAQLLEERAKQKAVFETEVARLNSLLSQYAAECQRFAEEARRHAIQQTRPVGLISCQCPTCLGGSN